MRTLATTLRKIADDLAWMNRGPAPGLGEITLPALQPGSSMMPGKVNPVIPEAVAMACAQVTGSDHVIALAPQSGSFQLNTMLPLIAYQLALQIPLLTQSAHALAGKALRGIGGAPRKDARYRRTEPGAGHRAGPPHRLRPSRPHRQESAVGWARPS